MAHLLIQKVPDAVYGHFFTICVHEPEGPAVYLSSPPLDRVVLEIQSELIAPMVECNYGSNPDSPEYVARCADYEALLCLVRAGYELGKRAAQRQL